MTINPSFENKEKEEKAVSFKATTETETVKESTTPKSTVKREHEDKYKKAKITLNQGYDYFGEKTEIGVILTLKFVD